MKFGKDEKDCKMTELVSYLIGLPLVVLGGLVVWESSLMIEEKKQRRRLGITDYYDNPIEKEDNETVS